MDQHNTQLNAARLATPSLRSDEQLQSGLCTHDHSSKIGNQSEPPVGQDTGPASDDSKEQQHNEVQLANLSRVRPETVLAQNALQLHTHEDLIQMLEGGLKGSGLWAGASVCHVHMHHCMSCAYAPLYVIVCHAHMLHFPRLDCDAMISWQDRPFHAMLQSAICLSMYECLHSTISLVTSQRSSPDTTILHQHHKPVLACAHLSSVGHLHHVTVAHLCLGTVVSLCMQVDQLVHAQELMLRLNAECNAELQARLRARKM